MNRFKDILVIEIGNFSSTTTLINTPNSTKTFPSIHGELFSKKTLPSDLPAHIYGSSDHSQNLYSYSKILNKGIIHNYSHYQQLIKKVLEDYKLNNLNETRVVFVTPNHTPQKQKQTILQIFFQ